jgi:hypothetical protein
LSPPPRIGRKSFRGLSLARRMWPARMPATMDASGSLVDKPGDGQAAFGREQAPAWAQNVPLPPLQFLGGIVPIPSVPTSQWYFSDIGLIGPGRSSCCFDLSVQDFANNIYNASVDYTINQQIAEIERTNQQIAQLNQKLNEGISLASALTFLPPNPGDRFSITFGGSGFNGYGAGAVTATARLSSNVIGFAGYARSQTENLVKGGVSISIH